MEKMNKRERAQATLQCDPVDRPPLAFWGHHYDVEFSLAGHVSSVLWWQRYLDLDILKVQCRASYQGEDWGLRYKYPQVQPFVGVDLNYTPPVQAADKPEFIAAAINSVEDWQKLSVLKPTQGALGERLAALEAIKAGLTDIGQDPIVLETVFNPISIAARLVGGRGGLRREILLDYLHNYPEVMHDALQVITETYRGFVLAVLERGVDGIFFATTDWASHDLLTWDEYAEFGKQYDLQMLEVMQDSVIVFHVCNQNNMLFDLADYPVDAFSWAPSDVGNPSLEEAKLKLAGKALMGGISSTALAQSSPQAALEEAGVAYESTGGKGWICAPNCSVLPTSPVANMRSVVDYMGGLAENA